MSLAIRRKVLYWIAAVSLVFMLAGPTVSATPVFADCTTSSSTNCTG